MRFWLFALVATLHVFPIWAQLPSKKECTEWYLEYKWDWESRVTNLPSNLVVQVSEFDDTVYIATYSGVSCSVDGKEWHSFFSSPSFGIQGMVDLNGQKLFWMVNDYLVDANGQVKIRGVRGAGEDWFAQRVLEDGQPLDSSLIITMHDTIGVGLSIHHIFSPLPSFFAINLVNNESYIFWNNELYPLEAQLKGEPILETVGYGNEVYLRTYSKLLKCSIAESRLQFESICPIENGDRLVDFDGVLVLKTATHYRVLSGSLNDADASNLFTSAVVGISRFPNFCVATSTTRGTGLAFPTGLSTYWAPHPSIKHVDGLIRNTEGELYVVNRTENFLDFEDSDGEVNFRLSPPLNVRLMHREFNFDDHRGMFAKGVFHPGDDFSREYHSLDDEGQAEYVKIKDGHTSIEPHFIEALNDSITYVATVRNLYCLHRDSSKFEHLLTTETEIIGFGVIEFSPETQKFWIGTFDSFIIYETGKPLEVLQVEHVRSLTQFRDGFILGTYGHGVWNYQPKSGLTKVQFDKKGNPLYISEVGFKNGVFFVLANSGFYYQDSAIVSHNLSNSLPVVLFQVASTFPIETNGAFFKTSIPDSSGLLVATMLGVLHWNLPFVQSATSIVKRTENWAPDIQSRGKHERQVMFWYNQDEKNWIEAEGTDILAKNENQIFIVMMGEQNTVRQLLIPSSTLKVHFWQVVLLLLILGAGFLTYWEVNKRRLLVKQKAQAESLKARGKSYDNLSESSRTQLNKLIEHDLKGGVNVLCQMLKMVADKVGGEHHEVLRGIETHLADHTQNISNRILGLESIDDVQARGQVLQAVEESIDELSHYAEIKDQRIEIIEFSDAAIPASELFKRCFHVILGNAIKYSPRGGRIEVRSVLEGNHLEVFVRDSGPGLPVNWKLGNGKKHKKVGSFGEMGMGIALQIASRIAMANSGSIELVNHDSGGVIAKIKWKL